MSGEVGPKVQGSVNIPGEKAHSVTETQKTSSTEQSKRLLNGQVGTGTVDSSVGNVDRSISTRPSDEGERFWKKMDKHFEDILTESKRAFKIKSVINVILIILGVSLVANAIIYGWRVNTSDGWSFFTGGIGIGGLVSLFFYKSQDALSKAVANLSVVDMVFKSHYRAYESITDYDYKADHALQHREIADLSNMLELLEKTTKTHVELIQQIQLIEGTSQETDFNKSGKDAGAAAST